MVIVIMHFFVIIITFLNYTTRSYGNIPIQQSMISSKKKLKQALHGETDQIFSHPRHLPPATWKVPAEEKRRSKPN